MVWTAGEKDCRDPGTGDLVECVICFEEFEQGQLIARLECLCRYHKVRPPPPPTPETPTNLRVQKCIREWFDRRGNGECPVHAVHD